MNIDSFETLSLLEKQIIQTIKRYKLDHILAGLRESSDKLEPFVIAGITSFAVRNCSSGKYTNRIQVLNWSHLAPLADLVTQYLIADPIGFDKVQRESFYSSNLVFSVLRLISHQFPFKANLYGVYARPIMLFREIPRIINSTPEIKNFPLEDSFKKINQVTLIDFLKVTAIAFSAALGNTGFTRSYFERAKKHGIDLPGDKEIKFILGQLTAYPEKFKKSYEQNKNENRMFAMYDFNPIFLYPIIRPWKKLKKTLANHDRMVAPVPNLIAHRSSMGIFYQLFSVFKTDFSNYFGHIFEYYIGQIIKNSLDKSTVISEKELRKSYPSSKGPIADWIIIENETVILIECKATRFSRAAVTTGSEEAINESLKQVVKGLRQLYKFKKACESKVDGLERFRNFSMFIPVLVTLEPLHMINSFLFREYINNILEKEGVRDLDWSILSMDQFEILQPHLVAGLKLSTTLERMDSVSFNDLLSELNKKSEKTFKDSFLYSTVEEFYEKLGIVEELESRKLIPSET